MESSCLLTVSGITSNAIGAYGFGYVGITGVNPFLMDGFTVTLMKGLEYQMYGFGSTYQGPNHVFMVDCETSILVVDNLFCDLAVKVTAGTRVGITGGPQNLAQDAMVRLPSNTTISWTVNKEGESIYGSTYAVGDCSGVLVASPPVTPPDWTDPVPDHAVPDDAVPLESNGQDVIRVVDR
jgi:hypothetical protein